MLDKSLEKPLAEMLRPQKLAEVIGQQHLLENNGALQVFLESKKIPSLILFGPPGVGKTSIAKLLAEIIDAEFIMISAITSGVADLKKIFDDIKNHQKFHEQSQENSPQSNLFFENSTHKKIFKKTLLMVDEIHHFNKTQQDLFLPVIEEGLIILVGTTTQNPSFHLNSALLSRCKILQLQELSDDDLEKILQRAEKILEQKLLLTTNARQYLISSSCGDARYLINACEQIFARQNSQNNSPEISQENSQNNSSKKSPKNLPINSLENKQQTLENNQQIPQEILLDEFELEKFITKRAPNFDKKGDFHFNLISAFHKSLRGSDVNCALYYLARMLIAKQDPFYIFRRLARFATEDIGIADPQALIQVMTALQNYQFLGSPEGDYALSYATIYCANAPKSNACYLAHQNAISIAKDSTHLTPPIHICDSTYVKAVNKQEQLLQNNINLEKSNSNSKLTNNNQNLQDLTTNNINQDLVNENNLTPNKLNYIYDHDTLNCFSGQEYLPEILRKKYQNNPEKLQFYQPTNRGFEKDITKRISYWQALKEKIHN
jgi:putative ATPase